MKDRVNDLDKVKMSDIYIPTSKEKLSEIKYYEALEHVFAAFEKPGKKYQGKLEEPLESRY